MIHATMLQAKTQLSALVRKAQLGEKVILTTGREKTPIAEIVALQPLKERPLGLFYNPKFELPDDFFDPLPKEELKLWNGEGG
jgi:antitoxin (DNA-binding transcriptional repressor) of toxin-antitoxin stability system